MMFSGLIGVFCATAMNAEKMACKLLVPVASDHCHSDWIICS